MFRARNNLLPFNLKKLYSIKLHNTYLFYRFKVRTLENLPVYLAQVLDYVIT